MQLSKEQLNQLLKLIKNSPNTSSNPSGYLAQTGNASTGFIGQFTFAPWIIDSGASNHMTSASSLFKTYSPCPGNQKVRIADENLSSIAGKGSIQISNNIVLNSVLHVPNLSCNLLSVSKLSQDSNCSIIFSPIHCEF
ncbi:hypothetical protein ACOSQ4_007971 [Xanthoceras sorbifolium]